MDKKIFTGTIKYSVLIIWLLFVTCSTNDHSLNPGSDTEEIPDTGPQIEDIVMYEVNLRAMSESGDFQGVINKLDHIKSLGVSVIWLMPIHPIGNVKSVNSPYSVQNYLEVNPEFGSFDDFKNLVQKAHTKDMSVIIDWVANHTAWDNPWIENKSWYSQNSKGEIISPAGTNWADVADLNYENLEMRLAMISAMKYWVINANIDGFRCDAADLVPYDFWRQSIDTLENIENKVLIYLAEGARANHFNAGFQMNYSWDFYENLKDIFINGAKVEYLFATNESEYKNVPEGCQKLRFTTNHDESAWDATPVELFGGYQGSFAAFTITACLGGVPLIYGSQEVGIRNNISFFSKDPIDWSLNQDLLDSYQKLLLFYNESDALKKGTIQKYNHSDILAFKKTYEQEEVLVMVNTRNRAKDFTIPSALINTNWKDAFDGSEFNLNSQITFEPYQYYILTKDQ